MNKTLRLSIPGILLILLGGFLPSAAHAGPSAQSGSTVLSQIKNNPCNGGGEVSVGGGRTAYLCNGWSGVQGLIDVPVKSWATSPDYPLVGVPFKIGVGVDPNYLRAQFPSRNITFPNQIRFFGYRTEISLVPFAPDLWFFGGKYNGIISSEFGGSISYRPEITVDDRFGAELVVPSFYEDPGVAGAPSSHPDSFYYPSTGDGNTKDSVIFSGYSSSSSYHAKNQTTYKGEPAFRLEVISTYRVEARASWDSYQEWERVKVGERTECRPGPSGTGVVDCMAIVGGWWQPGHYVTVDIYNYQWGPAHAAGSIDWVTVDVIDTNKVAWPDGSIHDHIPILIYQAQPILQKP